ncbi:hypothetical protein P7K49_012418, partial [Saguinus oedipus]
FFAHKVEHESRTQNGRSFQRTGTLAFERVYTAKWQLAAPSYWVGASGIMNGIYASGTMVIINFNVQPELRRCVPHFPRCALDCGATLQPRVLAPIGAATDPLDNSKFSAQCTPGYIFGKRIILFLFLMSLAGIFNYYLIFFFGSDFENYIKTITTTISPLLLIP